MSTLATVVLIFFFGVHYVFDFRLQKREWAEIKHYSYRALTKHVGVYMLGIILACLMVMPFTLIGFEEIALITVFNGASHWCIDGVTSTYSHQFYRQENFKAFWNTIGFDQFLHAAILIWTINAFMFTWTG